MCAVDLRLSCSLCFVSASVGFSWCSHVIADMWVRMCVCGGGGNRVPAVSEGAAVRETG